MIQYFYLMPKVWKIAPKVSDDLIEQLLHNRGIKLEAKEKFFNPKLSDFKKDLEIPGIPEAIKRIKQAIDTQELIVVHGDYDVDGICGAAILYLGLTSAGAKVLPYIPHREKEGYGLSKLGVDFAKDAGAKLLITVDCGIVAFSSAEYTKKLGLDLIITDHHQSVEAYPEAYVIVHSTKMCGTAVAWCLLTGLVEVEATNDLLDYVAMATVCDMMPLEGVNRCLVKLGLEQLKQTKRVGLLALCTEAGILPDQIDTYHIGFILGPRLNAIGRLEHGLDGLRLLCTKDPIKARRLAKVLSDANDQRKILTLDALLQARDMVMKQKMIDQKIAVLSSKYWMPGIIGLVAGKICEEFNLASIAISEGEAISKGSARSVNGLNIVETIRRCQDLLIDVGGHEGACGFTIETAKIGLFKQRIVEQLSKENLNESEVALNIEVKGPISKLSKDLYLKIQQFAPFGFGNPQPILASFGVIIDDIRTVGEGKHLKSKIEGVDAIAFGMGALSSLFKNGQLADVAYYLELDNYQGREKLQMKIKDLKLS